MGAWHSARTMKLLASGLLLLALASVALGVVAHRQAAGQAPVLVWTALLCAVLLAAAFTAHARRRKLARDPACEAALNQPATDWLQAQQDFERVRLPDESPRETVFLEGPGPCWLLVTSRRVRLFRAWGGERRQVSEWPRRLVVFAGAPADLPGATLAQTVQRLLRGHNLAITFATGTTIQMRCASDVSASRVARLLMSSPYVPDEQVSGWAPMPASAVGARRRWF